MMIPLLALMISLISPPTEAAVHVDIHPSGVHLAINPWSPHYRPPARHGWVWVSGHWEHGDWIPGHWVPARSRPGYVWVNGYWNGAVYVDGYWRSASRSGFVWVSGHYC